MRVGIDMIECHRFEKMKQSHLEQMFTKVELTYISQYDTNMRKAGIYACKEAFLKAIGVGVRNGISFLDIEVCHEENGRPFLEVKKEIIEKYRINKMDVSISHTTDVATAICILEIYE